MIRFLSEILKKYTKLAKIVKISEIFNRLVFPLNFNQFCHPMTLCHIKMACNYNGLDSQLRVYIIVHHYPLQYPVDLKIVKNN